MTARNGLAHAVASCTLRIFPRRQLLPLAIQRNYEVGDVVAQEALTSGRQIPDTEAGRTVGLHEIASRRVLTLRDIDLPLEIHDAAEPLIIQLPVELQMRYCRFHRLRPERGLARIRQQIHRARLPAVGIATRRQSVLADECKHSKALMRDVPEIGHGTRSPVDRHHGMRALQSILWVRVAPGRVAHDFERELRLYRRAINGLRRPWKKNSKEASFQQHRVRLRIAWRKMRAVHAVHRREQRILALGLIPSTTDHLYRQGHRTCRLMTGDTGAPVLADGFKEGMADGIHGACGVHQADAAESVWIGRKSGKRLAAGRRPPVCCCRRRSSPAAGGTRCACRFCSVTCPATFLRQAIPIHSPRIDETSSR